MRLYRLISILLIVCLQYFTITGIFAQKQTPQKMDSLHINMPVATFQTIFPEAEIADKNQDVQWSRKETIHGLPGEWTYSFKKSALEWFQYSVYIDDINEKNFNQCLAATKKLIAEFTNKYGNPVKIEKEDTTYKDPMKQRHWGYDVISAIWKTEKMKFRIEFVFHGAKGMYNFIVKMEFHDKNYSYF